MQLIGGKLYHVQILCGPDHVYLFMDIHHIICDGTSQNIILHDILRIYEGKTLEQEKISMAECIKIETESRKGEGFQKACEWYLKTFDCSDVDTTLLPDNNLQEPGERVMERTLSIDVQEVEAFGRTLPVYAKFDAKTTTLDFLKGMQEQMRDCRNNDIFS